MLNIIHNFFSLNNLKIIKRAVVGSITVFFTLCISFNVNAALYVPFQTPLFLVNPIVPLVMLNMTKDHQLYMKLYDDYSDLDGDNILDTTFKNSYLYYGYFDNKKCYEYKNDRFEPKIAVDSSSYCDGQTWSGNFLNWGTMTRIDAVRKILYGGYRSVDNTDTVLERVLLPHDAHAFAKYYNGTDLAKLIPSNLIPVDASGRQLVGLANTADTGITLCNTTHASNGLSQSIDSSTTPPLIRIAKGNYELWASNETWQCTWSSEHATNNSNNTALSGIYAKTSAPADNGVNNAKIGDYNARVQVCKANMMEANCKSYRGTANGSPTYYKPTGLLNKYGEVGSNGEPEIIKFGLITGSFSKNKSGGVVRKNISTITNEINQADGTFKSPSFVDANTTPTTQPFGIIGTLNMLRIHGYSYSSGGYTGSGSGEDNCNFGLTSFANGQCTNWGNPQAEMYLESLRYYAGHTINNSSDPFDTSDNTVATGINRLPKIDIDTSGTNVIAANGSDNNKWIDPIDNNNYCAPLNIIQFNASVTSYDSDELTTLNQITNSSMSSLTDLVGDSSHENLYGQNYFVGNIAGSADVDYLCTGKQVNSLYAVSGTCPDAPHLGGSYNIAGLAYYARTHAIRSTPANVEKVRTYGVELAPAIPSVDVAVPGTTGKVVRILPACKNNGTTASGTSPEGNCGLVSFKVVSQSTTSTKNSGTLYVNWEAAEQGGDFDQDMWGVIKYEITATTASITTDVLAQSSGRKLGFGFVLSGTSNGDGFHAYSGSNGFPGTNAQGYGCTNCQDSDPPQTHTYNISTTGASASFLKTPLYYAAKWGGYSRDFETASQLKAAAEGATYNADYLATQVKNRVPGDTYYYARDPYALEDSLDKAFTQVANDIGSAASVATTSARLTSDQYIYQAQFRSGSWDGVIRGYAFNADGSINYGAPSVSHVPALSSRKILMNVGGNLRNFTWSNLSSAQQMLLSRGSETNTTNAQKRFDWLTGSQTYETSGLYRSRTTTTAEITLDSNGNPVLDANGNPQTTAVIQRNIIGDIVNSSPAYVGATNYHYDNLTSGGSTYAAYVQAKKANAPRLLIGANDGMLHSFIAVDTQNASNNLLEQFAFVPNLSITLPKMANVPELDYGKTANSHQYIVDGPVVVGDVYIQRPNETSPSWHTIVVGTLGAGGRGMYALDVTNPNQDPVLLWEISNTDFSDLGYVTGKPIIMPLANGRWGVVFGNGQGGTNDPNHPEYAKSKLFVVDIEDPLLQSKIIDTGGGAGLSAPAILSDAKGRAVSVYAGDISGNLWSFDLSNSINTNWSARKLFTAIGPGSPGVAQPITAAPTVGINAQLGNKYMVYFGTGKYIDKADITNLGSFPIQSFYAIADKGSLVSKSDLLQKTATLVNGQRVVSTTDPVWVASGNQTVQSGWYLDFNFTSYAGERVTTKAILLQDKVIFSTLVPTVSPCEHGGKSWLMEIPAVGDKFVGSSILGASANISHNYLVLGDLVFGILSNGGTGTGTGGTGTGGTGTGGTGTGGTGTGGTGSGSGGGGGGGNCNKRAAVLDSGSNGQIHETEGKVCPTSGRQSWRQLR